MSQKTFDGTKLVFFGTSDDEIHVCIEKVYLSDRNGNIFHLLLFLSRSILNLYMTLILGMIHFDGHRSK